MSPVLSGRSGLPVGLEEKMDRMMSMESLSPSALRAAEEAAKRDFEIAKSEQENANKVLQHVDAIRARYKVASGKLLVSRDPVQIQWDDSGVADIAMTDDRRYQMVMHANWGTVLIVGEGFNTDYGQRVEPDVELQSGARVMYNPAGADAVEVSAGGETMTVMLIGFRGVQMIDRGEVEQEQRLEQQPSVEGVGV